MHWHDLVTVSLLGTDRRDPPDAAAGPARRRRRRRRRRHTVRAHARRRRRLRRGAPRRHRPAAAGGRAGAARRPTTARCCRRPRPGGGGRSSPTGRCWRTSGCSRSSAAAGGCRPTCWSACCAATAPTAPAGRGSSASAGRSPAGWPSTSRRSAARRAGRHRPPSTTGSPASPSRRRSCRCSTAPAEPVVAAVIGGLGDGTFGLAHRAVLVNFVARVRPDVLAPLAAALAGDDVAGAQRRAGPLAAPTSPRPATRCAGARPDEPSDRRLRRCRPAPARRGPVRRRAARPRRARRPAATTELAAVAVGRRHVPPRRRAGRRHADHPEVRRPAPPRRDRRGDAGHRPCPAAARRAGHGQDVGQRAPRRGDQRRLHAARAGHGGHDGGVAALRLELRPAARRGPERGAPSCRARCTGRCAAGGWCASRS